jgi:hypothetical protein
MIGSWYILGAFISAPAGVQVTQGLVFINELHTIHSLPQESSSAFAYSFASSHIL